MLNIREKFFEWEVLTLSLEVGDQRLQGDITHISSSGKHFKTN